MGETEGQQDNFAAVIGQANLGAIGARKGEVRRYSRRVVGAGAQRLGDGRRSCRIRLARKEQRPCYQRR
jgi:hypothetical protein